jgi:electron transfer flavoprotein alpha subunit
MPHDIILSGSIGPPKENSIIPASLAAAMDTNFVNRVTSFDYNSKNEEIVVSRPTIGGKLVQIMSPPIVMGIAEFPVITNDKNSCEDKSIIEIVLQDMGIDENIYRARGLSTPESIIPEHKKPLLFNSSESVVKWFFDE